MPDLRQLLRKALSWQNLFYFSHRGRFRPMLELRRFDPFALALCTTFRSLRGLRFLQIGANDGVSGDPLFDFATRFGWKGKLFEPVPDSFAKLCSNYRAFPECVPVNAAVGLVDGQAELFCVDNDGSLPPWASQVASFSREHVMSFASICPGLSDHISSLQVKVAAVDKLFSDQHLRPDVLLLDVEGFDYELLSAIAPGLLPDFVSFEYSYMTDDQWRSMKSKLQAAKFTLWISERDVVAFRVRN